MDLITLCQLIQQRHQSGENYQSIADNLHISKGMAYQIAHGYSPGPVISRILQLDPPSRLQRTRSRRDTLNSLAQQAGFSSWCAYETWVIHRGSMS